MIAGVLTMPVIFEYRHEVKPSEIDVVGHVNNVEYLRWLQQAAFAHSAVQGWPPEAYLERGFGWVARTHHIDYLSPAFLQDVVVIRTWVANMKRVTSLREYELFREADGRLLASASTNWAFVNLSTHQPCRIPEDVTGCFEVRTDSAVPRS